RRPTVSMIIAVARPSGGPALITELHHFYRLDLGRSGEPTNWINVYRKDSGYVHGSPGRAPRR
ncbi:hypothetical protein AB0L40_12220, partial [Patulibacter sp. NPDC049589]|uniref:hypothetical protein n=1 Tax=Patulibacter sp. NPDC049589 TaxID=3154731 RepID=UPI0034401816